MIANDSTADRHSDKKALAIVHLLHPYVKQRIRVAEILGIFPRNMYKTNEIIDEAILQVYEKGLQKELEPEALRLTMFDRVCHRLMELMRSEEWHTQSISTKLILEDELKQLEENFTMDADNDLVMNEDLDDISYHLEDRENASLPYDDQEEGVKVLFGLEGLQDPEPWKDRKRLRKLYYKLPLNTSNIMDLYVLGKLSFAEIASIMNIEMGEVKEIMNFVKETFRKQLE